MSAEKKGLIIEAFMTPGKKVAAEGGAVAAEFKITHSLFEVLLESSIYFHELLVINTIHFLSRYFAKEVAEVLTSPPLQATLKPSSMKNFRTFCHSCFGLFFHHS